MVKSQSSQHILVLQYFVWAGQKIGGVGAGRQEDMINKLNREKNGKAIRGKTGEDEWAARLLNITGRVEHRTSNMKTINVVK